MRFPITKRFVRQPGQKVAIGQSKIHRDLTKNTGEKPEFREFQGTSIPVTEATLKADEPLQIDYSLHLGGFDLWKQPDEGPKMIYYPAKGEWTGSLKAGGFPLEVHPE